MKANTLCKRVSRLFAGALFFAGLSAYADPEVGQSKNVVIVGGTTLACGGAGANYFLSGGCLGVSGPAGELGDFNFSAMDPANVSTASLASANADTVVLNFQSPLMNCNADSLSTSAKADLVSFVGSGKKLIIYDSECPLLNYTWLPYPFQTSNPGPQGATGKLSVVENNLLSTWVGDDSCSSAGSSDPHCINSAYLSAHTDAVGDMNVMTTRDQNWCVDMAGSNVLSVAGPVHAYANYPSGSDKGLIIYNGLDQDYSLDTGIGGQMLRKIWLQELQEPFNPSGLACRVPVIGIALSPQTSVNEVGTDHTVTAQLEDGVGKPQSGILVTFNVAGVNAGAVGTCTSNSSCNTDANGKVSFTYKGVNGIGKDTITACFKDKDGIDICSNASKEWIISNKAPICDKATPSLDLLWPPNHKFVPVDILGVTDPDVNDSVSIKITGIRQDESVNAPSTGNTSPDGQGVGTSTAKVRSERIGDNPKVFGNGRVYHIQFTASDNAANPLSCKGEVLVGVPHDQGQHVSPIDDGPIYDSTTP